MSASLKTQLLKAAQLAQAGEWNASHKIVQDYSHETAYWIHATLHKIEGDERNSRYWYAKCNVSFEDFLDNDKELNAIIKLLTQ